MKQIYLDYAAATPLDSRVLAQMEPFFSDKFYNPSAIYLAARSVRRELDEIRHRTAVALGAKPAEIVFTAGATEANNLAIQGVMKQFPEGKLLVSSIEHESVLEPAKLFGAKEAPVGRDGQIILNKLSKLITDDTVLVSVMMVNNELGTIQPLKDIALLLEKERARRLKTGSKLPIYLHTDAAQAPNYLDIHTGRLGIDMMSLNGGKIYGPKQSGALYIKAGVRLAPLLVGGGQEFGLRSGTENVAAAAGFTAALEIAQKQRKAEADRVTKLRLLFEDRLQALTPGAIVNGSGKRASHLVNVTFPGKDNERLMMELDEAGIMCAVGSACSAARDEASHVLSAIGLSEAEARATLRFSLGRGTSEPDITKTIDELAKLNSV
jgi:cysteine desulfurase